MSITVYNAAPSEAAGQVLRDARKDAGYSVAYMAMATGFTERQIRNWEAGRSPIKRAIVLAWAFTCSIDPDELVEKVALTARYHPFPKALGSTATPLPRRETSTLAA